MIDLACAAGYTNHLALYATFELCRVDIKGRTFVETGEQKFGMFGNLERNWTLLGLNPDKLPFFIDPYDKPDMIIMCDSPGVWGRTWLTWNRSGAWLARLRMKCAWLSWNRSRSWGGMMRLAKPVSSSRVMNMKPLAVGGRCRTMTMPAMLTTGPL